MMSYDNTMEYIEKLHNCVVDNDIKEISSLLDSENAHIECRDQEGTTPLILAAAHNRAQVLELLIKRSANCSARNVVSRIHYI
ncbi:hypothetical protein A3Q56_07685 [Intoshia linei]|uniref:Uncharacterized protein n=1 Tax=Intoshia linei TaxID=1819745 RepID=A0A177ARH9_9BILA|nr:hypothetical protein A3Q56_07685 [Intoshia linei]